MPAGTARTQTMTYGVRSFLRRVAPARVLRAYWKLKGQLIRWRRRQGQRLVSPLQASLTRVSRTSVIVTDYPGNPRARWGWGSPPPPHPELSALFAEHRDEYQRLVDGFRRVLPGLRTVTSVVDDPEYGFWDNEFFGNLDGIALYTLISSRRPSQYVEVGSGISTRLARRAIDDSAASTKLLSIDPEPRADIDRLCDEMHRVTSRRSHVTSSTHFAQATFWWSTLLTWLT
jgi:hypothetical protein